MGSGRRGTTAIWFTQSVGRAVHVIDFYENRGKACRITRKCFPAKIIFMGRITRRMTLRSGSWAPAKSRRETAWDLGINFRVVPKLPVEDGLHAAQMLYHAAGLMRNSASQASKRCGNINGR